MERIEELFSSNETIHSTYKYRGTLNNLNSLNEFFFDASSREFLGYKDKLDRIYGSADAEGPVPGS